MTDARLWARLSAGGPPLWRAMTSGTPGARIVERDGGVFAVVMPCSPERSIFNTVAYTDGAVLLAVRDELEAVYREAGVRAWTVWLNPGDTEAAAGLLAAGHVLDGAPTAMGGELAAMDLAPRGVAEIRRSTDWLAHARLNAEAYGWPPDDWVGAFTAATDALGRLYVAGDPAAPDCGAFLHLHDGNAEVCFVATRPQARGRGLASELLRVALSQAAADGITTTTLEATAAGRPLYERLGFRALGTLEMYERRAP